MSDNIADLITKVQFWLRLAVLLQGPLRDALLDVLYNTNNDPNYTGLPTDPTDLYNELQNTHGATIQRLHRTKVIKKFQLDLLFPSSDQKTYSDKFDITLIVVLIINCTDLAPQQFWRTPVSPLDTSVAAHVVLAREWRNSLLHEVPFEIDENEFNHRWRKGVLIIMGLRSTISPVDLQNLKKVSLEPKDQRTFLLLKVYIDANNERIDRKLEENKKALSERIDVLDARLRTDMERKMKLYRDETSQLKAHVAKIEEVLAHQNKIILKPLEENEGEFILPEVVDIVRGEIGEDWKERLFDYHKMSWSDVLHAFCALKDNHRKYLIDEIRSTCLLAEVCEKGDQSYALQVLRENIEDVERYHDLVGNLIKQVPNMNHWKVLKKGLKALKRKDLLKKIESSILLKDEDEVNTARLAMTRFNQNRAENSFRIMQSQIVQQFNSVLQGRVLEVIHQCLGEEWTNLLEKSKLYRYLALKNGQLTWRDLKKKLKDTNLQQLIGIICEKTLLTYGLRESSKTLKRFYIDELLEMMVEQPFLRCKETKFRRIPREEGYIDLAIIHCNEADQLWNQSPDRDYHLNLNQREGDLQFICMEDILTKDEKLVVVRGVAGVGKSTMADTYVFKWAKEELFDDGHSDIPFILKFSCRWLNNLNEINSIPEIILKAYSKVFDEKSLGSDFQDLANRIIIMIDGIDELKELVDLNLIGQSKIRLTEIENLISPNSHFLKDHKSMVLGRPEASEIIIDKFKKNHQIKIVEVRGFNAAGKENYIDMFYYNDVDGANEVKSQIKANDMYNTMAQIPVYLWVICAICQEKIRVQEVTTTTELFSYACLFLIKNDLKLITFNNLNEVLSSPDIHKIIIALADLSMLTLSAGKIVFTREEVSRILLPMSLEQTGFITKYEANHNNEATFQFNHLVLHEFLCAVCIHMTGCFEIYRHNKRFQPCLPILSGLASIETQLHHPLRKLVCALKECCHLSYWQPYRITKWYYSKTTFESYLQRTLAELVNDGKIELTEKHSSLLAAIFEFKGDIDWSLLQGKDVYIKEIRFQHHIRNAVYLLTKKLAQNNIAGVSIRNIPDNVMPSNLYKVFELFYANETRPNVRRILSIQGGQVLSTVASVTQRQRQPNQPLQQQQQDMTILKTVALTLNKNDNDLKVVKFLDELIKNVDKVILHTSTEHLYGTMKAYLCHKKREGHAFTVDIQLSHFSFDLQSCLSIYSTKPVEYIDLQGIQDRLEIEQIPFSNNIQIRFESYSRNLPLGEYLNLCQQTHLAFTYDVPFYVPFYENVNITHIPDLPIDFIQRMTDGFINTKTYHRFHVKVLDISNCLLSIQHLRILLPHIGGIKSLALNGNHLQTESINLLLEQLRQQGNTLHTLSLSKCYLKEDDFLNLIRHSNYLKHLDVSNNQIAQSFKPYVDFCRETQYEETSLNLSNCKLTDRHFVFMLPLLLKAQHVDLSFNTQLTDLSVMCLKHALHNTKTQLKSISMIGCFTGNISTYLYLLACLPTLESIDFRHNKLDTWSIHATRNRICQNQCLINSLALSVSSNDNFIALSPCFTRVKHLTLILTFQLLRKTAIAVRRMLKKTKISRLRSIDFQNQNLSESCIAVLFPAFVKSGVKSINLSGVHITTQVAEIIRDSVSSTSFVQSLNLSNCNMLDDHVQRLLPCIHRIEKLDLHNNPEITRTGIEQTILYINENIKPGDAFRELRIGFKVLKKN